MKQKKKVLRSIVSLLIIASFILLAACSGNNNTGSQANNNSGSNNGSNNASDGETKDPADEVQPPLDISIMMPSFETELPDNDSPVVKALGDYTNTNVDIKFVPNSSYEDSFNITLASSTLPTIIVVPSKTPSFINAARSGAFWELGPYLEDYPNLSQANEVVLNNSSIDGKIYGIYRARTLGRMGVTVRKDWLDNLNMDTPTTIDEFYEMLRAFTHDDPNQSGKNDTYGTVITKYAGPWDIMQTWFGVPNKWGDDGSGSLVPAHLTPEYMDALRFFKKMYDEGLVNEDFAVMDPGIWVDPIVNGEAGSMVDVADAARRIDQKIKEVHPDSEYIDVFGGVEGPEGLKMLPTSGYSGMLAISKEKVKTEDELKRVLDFIDKLNDEEMQVLLYNGVDGRHFNYEGEYITPVEDQTVLRELRNLNQMLMSIPEDKTLLVQQTPVRIKVREVQDANVPYVVGNPAEPLISDIYAQNGPQLDNIIADARVQFIVGQIDEAGFEDAIALWKRTGGDQYVKEINELHAAAKQ